MKRDELFNFLLDSDGENQMGNLSWIIVGAIAGCLTGLVIKDPGFDLPGDLHFIPVNELMDG